ncbi:MAG: hypothetical protein PHV11_03815 [Candidatus Bipolaricaulis sp.]|nr:hypothetical protein [Candidatus Bipolaricaulis sp.]
MDIKAMGEKVSEALALKGRVDSLKQELTETNTQIKDADRKIAELQALIPVRDTAASKAKALEAEISEAEVGLAERLDFLAQNKIILPLDNQVQNRVVRL